MRWTSLLVIFWSFFFKFLWCFPFCRGKVIDNWTFPELYSAFEKTYTPGSKTAVFYKKDLFGPVFRDELNKSDPPILLQERLEFESRGLVFRPQHFLFNIFDRKLQQYIEADLVSYNNQEWNEDGNPKICEEYKEPFAILTLSELEAGFVVCLLPLFLIIFVFCIEWIPTLKRLVIFYIIFKKYCDTKQLEQLERNAAIKVKIAVRLENIQEENDFWIIVRKWNSIAEIKWQFIH